MSIKNSLNSFLKDFSQYLDGVFIGENYHNNEFLYAIKYSVFSGGKRIRAFIIYYIGTHVFNIEKKVLLHLGMCIEMIHTYTLIHDDLPSMDNDDYRRGQLASHRKFDEATAILVGDSLLSDAFYFLSCNDFNIASDIKIKLINNIAKIIGSNNLIMGQFLDIRFSKSNNKSKEDILNINSYKTSKLFSLCSLIPAIVAQDEYKQKQLGNWGELFGDTFQMLDDKQDINDNKTNLFSVFNDEEFALMLKRNRKKMEEIAKESNILELISLMELIAWGENGI